MSIIWEHDPDPQDRWIFEPRLHPSEKLDPLRGARGILLALALCSPIWIALAVVIWGWNR